MGHRGGGGQQCRQRVRTFLLLLVPTARPVQLERQRPLHSGPLTAVDTVAESQDKQHVAIYMSLGEKQEWPAGASLVV